jgi:hypothetical protein
MRIHPVVGLLAPAAAALFVAVSLQTIAVRQVAAPSAATTETFGGVLGIRELRDGRVLIDDAGRKRLLLFDARLSSFTVVSDTMPGAKNPYGDSPAPIIEYGDSTLFLPWSIRQFWVIDPKGDIVRIAALPKASDMGVMAGSRMLVDSRGQLIYRARAVPPRVRAPASGTWATQAPDSSPIVRASFDTRTIDTIAYVRTPIQPRTERTINPTGGLPSEHVLLAPVSMVDDWTVTSDGTLAIVRGGDYHVDWISPDGVKTSTPRMPFDWRKFTEEEKRRLADSAVKYWRDRVAEARAKDSARPPRPERPGVLDMGYSVMQINKVEGATMSVSGRATVDALPLSDMTDYYPPVRGGTVKADLDGNVWLLPNTSARSAKGGIVYDVVNRKGELFERVEMPRERSIAGFGPNGTIYMMWRDSTQAWRVERTRVRR